jgi:hypothetical protein
VLELITLMRKEITNRIAISLVHATSTIIIPVATVFVLARKEQSNEHRKVPSRHCKLEHGKEGELTLGDASVYVAPSWLRRGIW